MAIFEKPPLETIPPVRERWTPLYLEHGRIEVDDASVKWIGADRMVMRIPIASLSALMLGPGTTITRRHKGLRCLRHARLLDWRGGNAFLRIGSCDFA